MVLLTVYQIKGKEATKWINVVWHDCWSNVQENLNGNTKIFDQITTKVAFSLDYNFLTMKNYLEHICLLEKSDLLCKNAEFVTAVVQRFASRIYFLHKQRIQQFVLIINFASHFLFSSKERFISYKKSDSVKWLKLYFEDLLNFRIVECV